MLLGVATLVFALIHLIPGDPVRTMLGDSAPEESVIELRGKLKQLGFLTRDARAHERKKYGQKGARKRFQFSKR